MEAAIRQDLPGETRSQAEGIWPPIADKDALDRRLSLCERMIDIAGAVYCIPTREIRSSGRTARDVTRVRQIAMYVTHVVLGLSMTDVGRGFGRDRTTVLHACHLVEDMRDDEDFDRAVMRLETIARAAFYAATGD